MKKKPLLVVVISSIFLFTTSSARNANNEPSDLGQINQEKPIKSSALNYLKNIDEPIHNLENSWIRLFTSPSTMTSTEIAYVFTSTAVTIGTFFVFYKVIKNIFTRKVTAFEKKSEAVEYLLTRNLLTYEEATKFLLKNTINHNLHTILGLNKDNPYVKFLIDCNPDIISERPSQANRVTTHHAHQD